MHLKLFRHLWGVTLSWEEAFPLIKSLDYAGIESRLPEPAAESKFLDLLRQHNLQFIAGVHTHGPTVREHLASFREQIERAKNLSPCFVVTQAGRDSFTPSDVREFYSEALQIEADAGVPVAFETHRSRPLFSPWATASILDQFPTLKLNCDFSHWVCVTERLPDDWLPLIRRAAEHAFHIHARVGYAQGPQVPDPRVAAYRAEVDAHEQWWDLIWDSQEQRGFAESTMCPEFGPPPYLQTHPQTGEPVVNLWDVVEWQHQKQRARFDRRAVWS